MKQGSRLAALSVVTLVFSYLFTIGATFNGILNPEFHPLTLLIMGVVVACWFLVRWRRRWIWYRTPVDKVMVLWIVAIGLSLIANWDATRRIAIGLWYVGVYIGAWYVLEDALQNGFLSRELLIDGLMIPGVVVLAFGFLQLQAWLRLALVNGFANTAAPRPVSVFGNPNFLSDFLIVLIPFSVSRLVLTRKRVSRIFLGAYLLLTLLLLYFTGSRGAWLGIGVALVSWFVLFLYHHGLLSRNKLIVWWQGVTTWNKVILLSGTLTVVAIALLISVIFIRSFSQAGRSADLRTEIYVAAIELFKEKPLTGQGLFTFGRELVRLPNIHPDKPHSHAHSVPLLVAAELGVVGIAALVYTLTAIAYWMRRNWFAAIGRERILLIGAICAVIAFAIHQLTDVPAMMPAIAFTGMLALVVAVTPVQAEPVSLRLRQPVIMVGLWSVLLAIGFWSSGIYSQYVTVLGGLPEKPTTIDYVDAASLLQNVVDADPGLSLYSMQQAFLYGMAASSGDVEAIDKGIEAYNRYIALEPGYAVAWANLAGLLWQRGDHQRAVTAMRTASSLDSANWHYQVNLARYAEEMGDESAADVAYRQSLTLYPDASLYPELRQYVLSHPDTLDSNKLTISARVAMLLVNGDAPEASRLLAENTQLPTAASEVLNSLVIMNNTEQAANMLKHAESLAVQSSDLAWAHMGRGWLAHSLGDDTLKAHELHLAREALIRKPLEADDDTLINIAYAQFLRFAIARQFLPQVYYPVDDPVLIYLLDNS
ncbi:MAG: O-antigen ligase family protein [Anaerolineae bacterium]